MNPIENHSDQMYIQSPNHSSMTTNMPNNTFSNYPQPNGFTQQQTNRLLPEVASQVNSSLPQIERSRYLSIHELTNNHSELPKARETLNGNAESIVNHTTKPPTLQNGSHMTNSITLHKPVSKDPQISTFPVHNQMRLKKPKTDFPVEVAMSTQSNTSSTKYSQPKTKRYKTQLHTYKMAMAQQAGFYRCSSSKNVLSPIGMQSINKWSPRLENVYDMSSTMDGQTLEKLTDSETGLTYMLKEGYVPFFELDENSKYIENPILFYEEIKHLGIKYGAVQVKTKNSIVKNNIVVNDINEQFKKDLDSFQFHSRHSIYNDPQVQIGIVSDFYTKLYEYYKANGMGEKFNKLPTVDKKPLDLWRLWSCVQTHGGFNNVCFRKMWLQIGKELGYSGKIMQSLATTLRSNYSKIFGDFTYSYLGQEEKGHTATTNNFAVNPSQNTKLCTLNTQHEQILLKDLKILENHEAKSLAPPPFKKRKLVADLDENDFESYYWHEGAEEYTNDYSHKSGSTPYFTIREMVLKNNIFSEFLQNNFEKNLQVGISADELEDVFQSLLVNPDFFYGVDAGYQVPSKFKHHSSIGFWNIKKIETTEQNLQRLQPVDYNNTHGSKYDITMMLSYQDWSSRNYGFPTMEYLEYGASKLWHVVPQSEVGKFESLQAASRITDPTDQVSANHNHTDFRYSYSEQTESFQNFSAWSKPFFENCTAQEYISTKTLNELGIKNYKIVQTPGTCVFTFDHAMTSKIASGFSFSENICFATESFFDDQRLFDPLFLMNVYWNGSPQQMEWAKKHLENYKQKSSFTGPDMESAKIIPQIVQKFYYDIDFYKNMSLDDAAKDEGSLHHRIGQMLSSQPYLSENKLKHILFQTHKSAKNTRDWQKISNFLLHDLPILKHEAVKFFSTLKPITFEFKWGQNFFLKYSNGEPIDLAELGKVVQYLRNCPVKCPEFEKLYDTYNTVLQSINALDQLCISNEQKVDIVKYHDMLTECLAFGVKYDSMQQHCQFYQKIIWFEVYRKLMDSKHGTYLCEQLYQLLKLGIDYDVESKHLSVLSNLIQKTCKINERIDDLFKKRHGHCLKVSIDEVGNWLNEISKEKLPIDQLFVDLFQGILDRVQSSRLMYEPLVNKLECNSIHLEGFTKMINDMEWMEGLVNNFHKNDQRFTLDQFKKSLSDHSFSESKASGALMTLEDLFSKEIQKTEEWLRQAFRFFKSSEHLSEIIENAERNYAIESFEQLQFACRKPTVTTEGSSLKVEHGLVDIAHKEVPMAHTDDPKPEEQMKDIDLKAEESSTKNDLDAAKPQELYCYCRKGDSGSTMVACEICQEWYHVDCVTNVNPDNQANDPDPVNNVFLCSMCFSGVVNLKNYDGIKFSDFQKLMIDYSKLKIVPNETLFVSKVFLFYEMALAYRNRMVDYLFDLSASRGSNSLTTSGVSIAMAPNATKFVLKADVTIEQCKHLLRKAMGGHCYFLNEIKSIKRFIRKTDINDVNKLKRKKIDIVTGYPLSEQPFKDKLHFLSLDEHYE